MEEVLKLLIRDYYFNIVFSVVNQMLTSWRLKG